MAVESCPEEFREDLISYLNGHFLGFTYLLENILITYEAEFRPEMNELKTMFSDPEERLERWVTFSFGMCPVEFKDEYMSFMDRIDPDFRDRWNSMMMEYVG